MYQFKDAVVTSPIDIIKFSSEDKLCYKNTAPKDIQLVSKKLSESEGLHLPNVTFTNLKQCNEQSNLEDGLKASRLHSCHKKISLKKTRSSNETTCSLRLLSTHTTKEKNHIENKCRNYFKPQSKKNQLDESHQKMQEMKNLANLAIQV